MMIRELKRRVNEVHERFGFYEPSALRDIVADVRKDDPRITFYDIVSAMMEVTRS